MLKFSLLLIFAILNDRVLSLVQIEDFYPFGPTVNDTHYVQSSSRDKNLDDGSSSQLTIATEFKFFGKTYRLIPPIAQATTPPTKPATATRTRYPTASPTKPLTAQPTKPSTAPPTKPPTATSTKPSTAPPTKPPTAPPTKPRTAPPTKPSTRTPTTPPTTKTTQSTRFIRHLAIVRELLNETGEYANDLCPYLLEKPSLQSRCFDEWMELEKRIGEADNATKLDELYTLESDLSTMMKDLKQIEADSQMTTKLPPVDISDRDRIFVETWNDIKQDIDDANKMAHSLCPKLTKLPPVQRTCFEQWKKLVNELLGLRNVALDHRDLDALEQFRKEVNDITKELDDIEKDSN